MAATPTPREVSITIGEEEYLLTPSFQAIIDIEQRTGKAITAIIYAAQSSIISFSDIVTIVWAGIKANYKATKPAEMKNLPKWDDLAENIQKVGFAKVLPGVLEFMVAVMNGSESIEGDSSGEKEKN